MFGGMDLSENLTPVAALIGTWRGSGSGKYPTIDPFEYTEEVTFTDVGKPFLAYLQRTWSPAGAAMHTETGYLRVPAPGVVELILSQPTGQTELLQGSWEETDTGIRVVLDGKVTNSATAKTVSSTKRHYTLSGDSLVTMFAMAAVGVPMSHHLESTLSRS